MYRWVHFNFFRWNKTSTLEVIIIIHHYHYHHYHYHFSYITSNTGWLDKRSFAWLLRKAWSRRSWRRAYHTRRWSTIRVTREDRSRHMTTWSRRFGWWRDYLTCVCVVIIILIVLLLTVLHHCTVSQAHSHTGREGRRRSRKGRCLASRLLWNSRWSMARRGRLI